MAIKWHPVAVNRELNQPGSGASTRHIEFDLDGARYTTSWTFGVVALNTISSVYLRCRPLGGSTVDPRGLHDVIKRIPVPSLWATAATAVRRSAM